MTMLGIGQLGKGDASIIVSRLQFPDSGFTVVVRQGGKTLRNKWFGSKPNAERFADGWRRYFGWEI